MEKRCSFELFKSNVCHWLKEEGDIDFLIQVLESDLIRKYYNDSAQKTPAVRNGFVWLSVPFFKKLIHFLLQFIQRLSASFCDVL